MLIEINDIYKIYNEGKESEVRALDGVSLTTAFTATLVCLTNVGPGLDGVGPVANFSGFSSGIKYLLSLMMLIGRLEIFPILLLFHPATWRHS